jgi:bifunctional non-homologous end joining protein LigD
MLHAFDLLELDGARTSALCPWATARSAWRDYWANGGSASCWAKHTDEDGAIIFRQACKMGLGGIVSKRLSAPYRSGPSRDRIKVKNPNSPAMVRHREERW